MSDTAACFGPVTAEGTALGLAMQRLWLTGELLPAGAKLTVAHSFQVEAKGPVEVIYSFPLPRDAALRRFRIEGDDFTAHSELKPTAAATEQYEEGIAAGSLSALARQYRDGVVNLSLGNLRPGETVTLLLEILAGVELRDDGFRFRFPFTLAPSYHAQARVSPEGEIELPAAEFGDVMLPRFRPTAKGLHEVGFDLRLTTTREAEEISSPSHGVRVRKGQVSLATEADVPDRDLVLDVNLGEPLPEVLSSEDGHFAAILPSTVFGRAESDEAPRRVAILLDRSGSMQGPPIQQAREAIAACLSTLEETDDFALLAFDNQVESFRDTLTKGTKKNREAARDFLKHIDARGGTELAAGVQAAAKALGGAGDVLILTDGQVSGTETILEIARKTGIRLHCLGIGSASQDRFLALLARETGGVSRFVTPRERVDMTAVDLFASISRPVAAELAVTEGEVQPPPPAMVFAGTPVLLFGRTSTPVKLTWQGGGTWQLPDTSNSVPGDAVRLLQGSRRITDAESRYESPAPGREAERVKRLLRGLSEEYGLASREMSLVAVVKRKGDQSGVLPETRVVAVGMPQDMTFNQVFVGAARPSAMLAGMAPPPPAPMAPSPMPASAAPGGPPPMAKRGFFNRLRGGGGAGKTASEPLHEAPPPQGPNEILLNLASSLESDGGLPGAKPADRVLATLNALLAFLSAGHSTKNGALRSHVKKMLTFLSRVDAKALSDVQQKAVKLVTERAERGDALPGNYLTPVSWPALLKALGISPA